MLHSHAFHVFKEGLKEGHKGQLEELEQLVRAWEQDPLKFKAEESPYKYPEIEGTSVFSSNGRS
jgi:hypothetical protein